MKVIMIRSILPIILFLGCINSVFSQNNEINEDNLIGKWKSYMVTTLEGKDGSEITFDGEPFKKTMVINFIDSKTLFFSINGSEEFKIEYSLEKNRIQIGHKKYTIKNLTNKKLILIEEKLLGNLIYLKKENS